MVSVDRHLVVHLSDDGRVAVLRGASGGLLPEIAGSWVDHVDLTKAVGAPTAFLLGPPVRVGRSVVHVVGGGRAASAPDGVSVPELVAAGVEPAVAEAVARTWAEWEGRAPVPAGRPAWFRRGWREETDAWVDDIATSLGLRRTGPTQAWKLWSLSAVTRVPVTDGEARSELWFKSACDLFRSEVAITGVLGRHVPEHVPEVVAQDGARGWMLMRPLPDTRHRDLGVAATAAAGALVAVQLGSRAFLDELRDAGAPDRGLDRTLADLAGLVRDAVELALLDESERRALRAAEEWLAGEVRELYASGLPVTVGHGDLHLGNVAGGEGCDARLYDWTDACLTHPLLDAVHLATSAGPEHADAVRDLVLGAWGSAVPDSDLASAWERAGVVDRIFQAASYDGIAHATEPASAWELRGVQADILRDLIERHRRATG